MYTEMCCMPGIMAGADIVDHFMRIITQVKVAIVIDHVSGKQHIPFHIRYLRSVRSTSSVTRETNLALAR